MGFLVINPQQDGAMVLTGLYMQALNEVFDDQAKRLAAFRTRVPEIVLLSLYGFSFIAIWLTAYASGLERRKWRLPVYITAVLVADVIALIQDIDRPSSGFVALSQQPMVDTAGSIAGFLKDAASAPRGKNEGD
jgi:hypothetical protein